MTSTERKHVLVGIYACPPAPLKGENSTCKERIKKGGEKSDMFVLASAGTFEFGVEQAAPAQKQGKIRKIIPPFSVMAC